MELKGRFMDPKLNEFVGEIREFKRVMLEQMGEVRKEISELKGWKMRVAGGSAAVSAMATLAIEFLFSTFRNHS
jgi:hypothetical protein